MKAKRKKHILLFLAAMALSLLLPAMAGAAETVCSHEWSDWEIWEMPSCTNPGKSMRYCRKCNEWESEEIPAKGHSWGEWTETRLVGCMEDGEKTRWCSGCSAAESEAVKARGYHNWDEWTVADEPTCSETGWKYRICRDCRTQEDENIATVDVHDWDDWYTEKSATALREGILARECIDCGKEETQPIPKLKPKAKLKRNIRITDKKPHSMSRYLTKTRGDKAAKWTSSNKKVATISRNGKLRARKNGKTTIRVKMKSGVSASCRVTVKLGKKTTQKKPSGGSGSGGSGSGGSGTVYYTPSGGKYHSTTGCPTLSRSRTIYSASVSEAQSRGLGPCKVCH